MNFSAYARTIKVPNSPSVDNAYTAAVALIATLRSPWSAM